MGPVEEIFLYNIECQDFKRISFHSIQVNFIHLILKYAKRKNTKQNNQKTIYLGLLEAMNYYRIPNNKI